MTKPLPRGFAERPVILEVDTFMRQGDNRWDSEFAAHAQEQRRIMGMIVGRGLGVHIRVSAEDEDEVE